MTRISVPQKTLIELKNHLAISDKRGDLRKSKRIASLIGVFTGKTYSVISEILNVSEESIRIWVRDFILKKFNSLLYGSSPGRPGKLTKAQKIELGKIIDDGPFEAGYSGACWRSPMIQDFIYHKYGVFYSVFYISELLKNMGFSYQKARFVSDHLDEKARAEWINSRWPKIRKLAKKKNAYILFGDEASFPQWGTLSYSWARRGKQPTVKTSGKRKGCKVFGLIEYFTGKFFSKSHEGRFNSESYMDFLKEVMAKTRKHLILIQDGARYHISKAVREFFEKHKNRITAFELPSYSPDYNPIEKLWKKIKEKEIHMHYFPTFEDLQEKVHTALLNFSNWKEEVLPLLGFYKKMENSK